VHPLLVKLMLFGFQDIIFSNIRILFKGHSQNRVYDTLYNPYNARDEWKVVSATILNWIFQERRKIFFGIINLIRTESDSRQENY
jgi:hypothetical protein